MNDWVFDRCRDINAYINSGYDDKARECLIRLLDRMREENIEQNVLVNHLLRDLGLYPYVKGDTMWRDRVVCDAFKTNTGNRENRVLHYAQSKILKRLLAGESLAISAPTSFGKSFIVDAYIAIKNPLNVVIIVPTIALTDETRRRLTSKFSWQYKIITTPDVPLGDRNIFIFPQERVFGYLGLIKSIDFLIVDEFYKAETGADSRSYVLQKAILELSKKAKQRYFLAPNISEVEENYFTAGMSFEDVNFKTVVTDVYKDYLEYKDYDKESKLVEKKKRLVEILQHGKNKSLVYAGSYSQTKEVIETIIDSLPIVDSQLLHSFSEWLCENYDQNYNLAEAVLRGAGIHNGNLHRSLSQIQIKLFEKESDINTIVSTSSIIEGVNTSAENVILWSNKNGSHRLTSFEYSNIIGRSGRMFQYFIGKVYALEAPPIERPKQLKLELPDEMLYTIDATEPEFDLTREQIIKIIAFKDEIEQKIGAGVYARMIHDGALKAYTSTEIQNTAYDIIENNESYDYLIYLNNEAGDCWTAPLRFFYYQMSHMDLKWREFVNFVRILSKSWLCTLPQLLLEFKSNGVPINIDNFFEYERRVSFELVSVIGKFCTILKYIRSDSPDISKFVFSASHAFLPKLVYELEEYGLPRVMSRKIHLSGMIDLMRDEVSINEVIDEFLILGQDALKQQLQLSMIETYILSYFFQGISGRA